MWRAVIVIACLGARSVSAQPASGDKLDAKALMQSGLKLFEAKDYLGALAVFRTANERFPSAKIVLNIATTLAKLDRNVEAANTYQQYLDADDADPPRRDQVIKVLAQLDHSLGIVEVDVTPNDAEIQLDDGPWMRVSRTRRYRVLEGTVRVRARLGGYRDGEASARVATAAVVPVAIALAVVPKQAPAKEPVASVTNQAPQHAERSRLGAILVGHLDPQNAGGAVLIGAAIDITRHVQSEIMGLLGPTSGGYAGARMTIFDGSLRPLVAAGLPIFVSAGPRVAVRGAAGAELRISDRISVIAELGIEYMLNPEPGIDRSLLVPALGVIGRL